MKVIWFSEIKWSYLKTRKQHLIEHFPPEWEILFIETYVRGKPNHFWPRRNGRLVTATVPFIKSTPFSWLNRVLEFVIVRWALNAAIGVWLLLLFRWSGFHGSNRILFTSNIYFSDLLRFFSRRLLVYDCNDYPPGFPGALRTAPSYFHKTIQTADLVTTVSDKLGEDIAKIGQSEIHIIGNGVDYHLFSQTQRVAAPADLEMLAHPIIMYVGVLSDWFDFDLVGDMATVFRDASIVLVGPVISKDAEARVELLKHHQNVHLLGAKPHEDLPAYIQCASVCVIPFIKNDLIQRFSPNKMYEYLAVGKPVVTLDYTKEITDLADTVAVARSAEEFLSKIREVITRPPEPSLLQHIAREKSWQSIAGRIASLVQNALQSPHK